MGKIKIQELSFFYVYHAMINEVEITHLKLQKILYYTQAYHLVYFNKHTIFDDIPEAWVNGPVYRIIYDSFKHLGVRSPLSYKEDAELKIEARYEQLKNNLEACLTKEQVLFINSIFNHFGTMTSEKLVYLTHKEKPWNEAREGIGPFDYSNEKISFDSMYNFYSKVKDKRKEHE